MTLAGEIWICDVLVESDVWLEELVMEGMTANVSGLYDVPLRLVIVYGEISVTLVDFFLSMVISVLVAISFSTTGAEISSSMVTYFLEGT